MSQLEGRINNQILGVKGLKINFIVSSELNLITSIKLRVNVEIKLYADRRIHMIRR